DGSVEFLQEKYPQIQVIANQKNVGFSAANNQGISRAQGEYVLLLNPDTVVAEDTLNQCITFLDAHPEAGGLGVKMLDGTGRFLPESKRAFPSPEVAFYKAFGLAALFPKSKVFGKYHLGYLHEDETHEVEVLAGAFMMLRRSALDKTGLLDENFFMYGEDIDLSYRIVKAGYKNYYFPFTSIIHYKGESTKKGSLNYVRMFYNAMKIFARKHFSGSNAGAFIFLINIAIYFRAFLAVCSRFTRKMAWPITDAVLIFISMYVIKEYWEYYVRYIEGGKYPNTYMLFNVPAYTCMWITALYFSGVYDKSANTIRIIRGIFWGTVVIAALYGFLPESLRFSRGMIIAGTVFSASVLIAIRFLHHFIQEGNWKYGETLQSRILIIGSHSEYKRALNILGRAGLGEKVIGYITTDKMETADSNCLGTYDMVDDIKSVFNCNEIIFCGKDITNKEIIQFIANVDGDINFKILPENGEGIIGSNSKNSAGDLYTFDMNVRISIPAQKRNKRVLDLIVSVLLLLLSPLLVFIVRRKKEFLHSLIKVLSGKYTWVGYVPDVELQGNLPPLKPCIFPVSFKWPHKKFNSTTAAHINQLYAKEYRIGLDISVIWQGLFLLK
ncbi:MAG: glycosyltransferase family 2 protein, partial [Chitinophagales bacterium]